MTAKFDTMRASTFTFFAALAAVAVMSPQADAFTAQGGSALARKQQKYVASGSLTPSSVSVVKRGGALGAVPGWGKYNVLSSTLTLNSLLAVYNCVNECIFSSSSSKSKDAVDLNETMRPAPFTFAR